ncbi:MAG: helix-turn-helix transcriptional regulator [Acidobacteria bacterium]|nr:helix-turn-helix transcriptional regulator [Acidobacteriota bacterium]MBV9476704.1 helix-turn-helix transcriptional regulator [Acidobacteriota bacterium]
MSEIREAIEQYLQHCFATETPPRVSDLAERLGMTREKVSRDFAAATGVALSDYLKAQQLALAQNLLASSKLSTTRIGYLSCFGTRRTFFRAFRRGTGMSPDEYRRASSAHS